MHIAGKADLHQHTVYFSRPSDENANGIVEFCIQNVRSMNEQPRCHLHAGRKKLNHSGKRMSERMQKKNIFISELIKTRQKNLWLRFKCSFGKEWARLRRESIHPSLSDARWREPKLCIFVAFVELDLFLSFCQIEWCLPAFWLILCVDFVPPAISRS